MTLAPDRPVDPRRKVVLITGGAGGMGRAIATRFIADGAIVVLADRTEAALAEAADALPGAGHRGGRRHRRERLRAHGGLDGGAARWTRRDGLHCRCLGRRVRAPR